MTETIKPFARQAARKKPSPIERLKSLRKTFPKKKVVEVPSKDVERVTEDIEDVELAEEKDLSRPVEDMIAKEREKAAQPKPRKKGPSRIPSKPMTQEQAKKRREILKERRIERRQKEKELRQQRIDEYNREQYLLSAANQALFALRDDIEVVYRVLQKINANDEHYQEIPTALEEKWEDIWQAVQFIMEYEKNRLRKARIIKMLLPVLKEATKAQLVSEKLIRHLFDYPEQVEKRELLKTPAGVVESSDIEEDPKNKKFLDKYLDD